MSYANLNNVKMVDKNLVDKILEQGQKLRNAMVGSILKNDPFNTEIIYNKHFNTPQTSRTALDSYKMVDNLTSLEEKRLEAFIKGEYMTREEEKLALDTLRSLSAPALCKTTEKSLNSTRLSSCRCYTCQSYNENNLSCDLRRKSDEAAEKSNPYHVSEITKDIQEKYRTENGNILKYVDSLKVSISSLTLNEMGNQKVSSYNDKKVPYDLSQTYFLEYSVPDCLVSKNFVSRSKVNSGLDSNHIRLCSRRNNDTINFRQVAIHDVKNLDKLNLNEQELKFKISFRAVKQKTASLLGYAKFSLSSFLYSKNLTCHRGLSVYLNENSPIVVGTLKVSLQLGCGRLYFGQEFIDAINCSKRNSIVLDSDDSASQLNSVKPNRDDVYVDSFRETHPKENVLDKKVEDLLKYKSNEVKKDDEKGHVNRYTKNGVQKLNKNSSYFERFSEKALPERKSLKQSSDVVPKALNDTNQNRILSQQISECEKQILFGFLYISEAQYLRNPISTYVTCRPFCQNETSCSKLVANSSHPIFNFCQLVPLIFEDELLHLLRENYMVIEFWRKNESTDIVFGLTKIFLHQFYLAYRNPVILKYLVKNQLPIIGTDWWEPIYAINTEEILGQVQVLVALGTEQQISNLKTERGFATNIVRAKFSHPKPPPSDQTQKCEVRIPQRQTSPHYNSSSVISELNGAKSSLDKVRQKVDRAVNTSATPKATQIKKLDVGVQSDLKMEKKEEMQEKEKTNSTQDMLGSFLSQLMVQRQRNMCVENSTNTETIQPRNDAETVQQAQTNTNVELRKTTDLLDSLQRALSLDGLNNFAADKKRSDTFKANIAINSANHLPVRKKCKSRKSKNRSAKNEENVLPSCYVTFETVQEKDFKITPVVPKTTGPVWNYKCDVELPIDLLTNNQKRLIFKVWRKSTNTVLQPNMQTDTVLGFAALDLTVLLAGFPNVQGWFNIVDFSGKCNGQINIHVTPLENLSRFSFQKECNCNVPVENPKREKSNPEPEPEIEAGETLSRALKRKFTELDEITQRLRLRLSKVTNEDSDSSSDDVADEFERDINTLCIEEDFNLINFEEEARKFSRSHGKDEMDSNGTSRIDLGLVAIDEANGSSGELTQVEVEKKGSSGTSCCNTEGVSQVTLATGQISGTEKELATLDKQLMQGKQRIDTLLGKLSLLSADTSNPFTSRYVSGCSINSDNNASNIDTEAILKELDHSSRPNIQSSSGFDPIVFQQLYGGSVYSNSLKSSTVTTLPTTNSNSNTDTSLITNFSDCRPAPDGQGNILDEKQGKK